MIPGGNIPLEWRTKLGTAVANWLAGRWGVSQKIALVVRKQDGTTYQIKGATFESASAERDYVTEVLIPDPTVAFVRQKGILDDLLPSLPGLLSSFQAYGADPISEPTADLTLKFEKQIEEAQTTITGMMQGLMIGGAFLAVVLILISVRR